MHPVASSHSEWIKRRTSYPTIQEAMFNFTLNGDCLSLGADVAMGIAPENQIRQRSPSSSPSRGKPGTWRSGTVYT